MTYKDDFRDAWFTSGGLITKATAAKILGVSNSVITKHPEIKRYTIQGDEFISLSEILERKDIKPRRRRRKNQKEEK